MAFGVNSVLNMGVGALFASQANIQTTGNNISNVGTPGYSRQAVLLNEKYAINYYPGQIGQGVEAKEIVRYFDAYIESNYLTKFGSSQRYESLYSQLRYVEGIFNESNVSGIGNNLSKFFEAWNKVAQTPNQSAAREALLSAANSLNTGIRNANQSLDMLQDQMNTMISDSVDQVNSLLKEIATLNRDIAANYQEGRNNPNQLMDKRDYLVRQLAGLMDITVDDRGPGQYQVKMRNGTTLVQDDIPFSLEMRGPNVENNLTSNSLYKGNNDNGTPKTAHFSGSDSHEYTIQMVTEYEDPPGSGNMVTSNDIGGTPPAKFKVSIDGGKTWLANEDGTPKLFNAQDENNSVRVGELDIWFDAGQVSAGDKFVISPKSDVYWISPTSGPMNISTQVYSDGTDNPNRITGGILGGYLEFRDYRLAEYQDRLNAFAKGLIWETNRIHSQGAGLTALTSLQGSYQVGRDNVPLGSPEALFTWADKLQAGNMSFVVYNKETGTPMVPYPGHNIFSGLPGGNFDPAKHSLQDVCDAINGTILRDPATDAPVLDENNNQIRPFVAEIVDGKLNIRSSDPEKYTFAVTDDTSGLAAALGLNTFFTGDSAATIGIRSDLSNDLNLINAGKVNGAGEINPGDGITAGDLHDLVNQKVNISTIWGKPTSQTIAQFYSSLVTKVGGDTQSVRNTAATESALAFELADRQEEISGVNLDEEMSNLIKFQASYKAAAKLITTADEMLQTLLSLKQ